MCSKSAQHPLNSVLSSEYLFSHPPNPSLQLPFSHTSLATLPIPVVENEEEEIRDTMYLKLVRRFN